MTRFSNSDLMVSVLPETHALEGACVETSDCKTKKCTNTLAIDEFVTDEALGVLEAQLDRVLIGA